VAGWLAVVFAYAFGVCRSWRTLRGIRCRARPAPPPIVQLAAEAACAVGVRKTPAVLLSAEVDTPQAVGFVRPAVMLPDGAEAGDPGEVRMALAHELAHVRRGDVPLGCVPACAERLFFFHPLARLAVREYLLAREAACDAFVLRALGVAPQEYGRFLLRLGVRRGACALSAAGSSSSAASLKRRLDMLSHAFAPRSSRLMWALGIVGVLAVLPYQLVARTSADQDGAPQAGLPSLFSSDTYVTGTVAVDQTDRDVTRFRIEGTASPAGQASRQASEPERAQAEAEQIREEAKRIEAQYEEEVRKYREDLRLGERFEAAQRQSLLSQMAELRRQLEREASDTSPEGRRTSEQRRAALARLQAEMAAVAAVAAQRGGRQEADAREIQEALEERVRIQRALERDEQARRGSREEQEETRRVLEAQLAAARAQLERAEAAQAQLERADQRRDDRAVTGPAYELEQVQRSLAEAAARRAIRDADAQGPGRLLTTMEQLGELQRARDSIQRSLAQLQAEQERLREAQRALVEATRQLEQQIERFRREAEDRK
jgi:hypothetical protein